MPPCTNDRRRALAAIFVYSPARGEKTEHYKIKQPIRQKSPLLAVFQFAALVLTLALAIFGGLLTGTLIVMALHHITFYIETPPDKTIIKMAGIALLFLRSHRLGFLTLVTSKKS